MSLNKTKINWPWKPLYTWNPITGCKRNCWYCYAKKMRHRFWPNVPWDELMFFDERLEEPILYKKPVYIFVGSMSDICFWGKVWIDRILEVIKQCPQHTFIFLTKSPEFYQNYSWPDNCILGVTITGYKGEIQYESYVKLLETKHKRLFISIEPLLGILKYPFFSFIEYFEKVIVGQMTGAGAIKSKPEWIQSIKDNVPAEKLYWKQKLCE